MKRNTSAPTIAALLLAGVLGQAVAQPPETVPADEHDHHSAVAPAATAPAPAAALAAPGTPASTPAEHSDLSEGEITRWDPRTLKVTLRHREIKNLGMPPMTMVFRVPDAGMVGGLQPGAKVLFRAEQVNGAYVLTRLQAAP
jgi:Cu/Ag efflux protein CusF